MWLLQDSSGLNPHLEVLLYHDRLQLATSDALYSDGKYYTPAIAVVNYLKSFCPNMQSVLLLGVGLGSMVDVVASKGYSPAFTLVEKDKVVLRMALDYLQKWPLLQFEPMVEDAEVFMQRNTKQYDLVFVDIFNSREVPKFVSTLEFLSNCRDSMAKGGKVALNYIISNNDNWKHLQANFRMVFPTVHVINSDINRILIGSM